MTSDVEVFVSINPGKETYNLPDWVKSRRLRINIGGDANIITGPTLVTGEYCWVIGDDEQMEPDAIAVTLEAVQRQPGLIIQPSIMHQMYMPWGSTFDTYGAFCSYVMEKKIGWLIAAHTLISSTVFRRDAYDVAYALQRIDSRYGFHYGMLVNLTKWPVYFLPKATMLYGKTASIFQHDEATIAEHMAAYPTVIYDIFEWIETKTGVHIPQAMWRYGFDRY